MTELKIIGSPDYDATYLALVDQPGGTVIIRASDLGELIRPWWTNRAGNWERCDSRGYTDYDSLAQHGPYLAISPQEAR